MVPCEWISVLSDISGDKSCQSPSCGYGDVLITVAALNIEYIVQFLLLVFGALRVLDGPIHGGNELGMSNCN
jgi:hypothetical protein